MKPSDTADRAGWPETALPGVTRTMGVGCAAVHARGRRSLPTVPLGTPGPGESSPQVETGTGSRYRYLQGRGPPCPENRESCGALHTAGRNLGGAIS